VSNLQTIELKHPLPAGVFPETCAALGFFDGVHRGHEEVIKRAIAAAYDKGMTPAVMTFFPHPKEVLRKEEAEYLTTLEDKKERLEALGVEILYLVQFDSSFASLSPQQFVDRFIIDLNIKHVVAGFDYTYGHKGKGTMDSFPFHARGLVETTTVEAFRDCDEKISSTAVRTALKNGDINKVSHYLGRHYTVKGKVVHGEKRGRTIGFPTANIEPSLKVLLPSAGVYAVMVEKGNSTYCGVANIGVKPTFHQDGTEKTLEVYFLDFSEDIYGETLKVEFIERLRGEEKFASVDELISQIQKDVEEARNVLSDS
jgi:riboflavin kinase / FMN adenylyltransferase